MKRNIYTAIFWVFWGILALGVVLISTKTLPGVPTIKELNSPTWTVSGPLELSPERGRFALLYSLVENGSFQFETEVARLATPDLGYFNGRYVSLFGPGTSILMIPGYLIGTYVNASFTGAVLTIGIFAIGNFILITLILLKLNVSRLTAGLAALMFLVATPAFTYSGIIYQHHISTFALLLSVYAVLGTPSLLSLAFLFLVFGFSALVDVPNVFFILPILILACSRFVSRKLTGRGITYRVDPRVMLSALAVLVPVMVFLAINYASYGNPFQLSNTVTHVQALDESGKPVTGRGADARAVSDVQNLGKRKRNALAFFKARHLITGLYAFSTSPDRGVLVFTPVMLLGFFGLAPVLKRNKSLAQALLGIICVNVLLYSMRSDPWGGWAFGSRYLIPSFSILAILLGLALEHYKKHFLFLFIFLMLAGYSIYVNTAGALSSTANPPQVEILSLEALTNRRERYSYDRNIEYLKNGESRSFVYSTWLKPYLSAWDYFRFVAGSLSGIVMILTSVLFIRKKTNDSV